MGTLVGVAVALKAQRDSKRASRNAARGQRQAAFDSAQILADAGKEAEADIIRQNALAAESAALAATESAKSIEPFADLAAIEQVTDQIIGNLPVSGAIADSIRQASMDAVRSRPEFQISGPVASEVERQGGLAVSAATPAFRDSLTEAAQEGLAATADVAGIRSRGLRRLGDIAGGQATQRASLLVGQTPALQDLATSASESRVLGDVVGQQFRSQATEQLAGLGGQLFERFSNRPDEFGFERGEDPFQEF